MASTTPEQALALLETLRTLYQRHLSTDLVVTAGAGPEPVQYHVHRAMIATFSGYFRGLLEQGLLQDSAEQHLPDIDSHAFGELLDFMYTGELTLTIDNIVTLQSLAELLQMPIALDKCGEFMKQYGADVDLGRSEADCMENKHEMVKSDNQHLVNESDMQEHQVAYSNEEDTKIDPSQFDIPIVDEMISTSYAQLNVSSDKSSENSYQIKKEVENVASTKRVSRKRKQKTVNNRNTSKNPKSVEKSKNISGKIVSSPSLINPEKVTKCSLCMRYLINSSVCGMHERSHGITSISERLSSWNSKKRSYALVQKLNPYPPVDENDKKSRSFKMFSKFYKGKRIAYGIQGRNVYECRICQQNFPLYVQCHQHVMKHVGSLPCKECGLHAQNIQTLMQHKRLCHSETSIFRNDKAQKCGFCARQFSVKSRLMKHIKNSHNVKTKSPTTNPKQMECSNCSKTFLKFHEFTKHACFRKLTNREVVIQQEVLRREKLMKRLIKKKRKGLFGCLGKCRTTFRTHYHAKLHVLNKHKKSKTYLQVLKEHPLISKCCDQEECDYVGNSNLSLALHMKLSHPEVMYTCTECGLTTQIKADIETHYQKKHGENRPSRDKCDLCDKSYEKPMKLRIHRASAHGIKDTGVQIYRCPLADCSYTAYQKSSIDQHLVSHDSGKQFACLLCDKRVKTKRTLEKHINKVHLKIRPFVCDVCGASYGENSELKTHMARHSEVKPLACPHCEYRTSDKGYLKSHMYAKHRKSEEAGSHKVFVCDTCGYSTNRKARYHEHQNKHTKERMFDCDLCSQTFMSRSTLKTHKRWKHSEDKLKCDFCEHTTSTNTNLREHIRVRHTHPDVKPFQCAYCSFRSATNGNCRKHIMNRHKGMDVCVKRLDVEEEEMLSAAQTKRAKTRDVTEETHEADNITTVIMEPNVSYVLQEAVDTTHVQYTTNENDLTQAMTLPEGTVTMATLPELSQNTVAVTMATPTERNLKMVRPPSAIPEIHQSTVTMESFQERSNSTVAIATLPEVKESTVSMATLPEISVQIINQSSPGYSVAADGVQMPYGNVKMLYVQQPQTQLSLLGQQHQRPSLASHLPPTGQSLISQIRPTEQSLTTQMASQVQPSGQISQLFSVETSASSPISEDHVILV